YNVAAFDTKGCRDAHQSEVPHATVSNLLEVELCTCPLVRDTNSSQDLAVTQYSGFANVYIRTNKEAGSRNNTLATGALDHHFGFQGYQRRTGVTRSDGHTTAGVENGVLTVLTFRRIGVAQVTTGTVAVQTTTVVPAAYVLSQVAAHGTYVADLWGGNCNSCLGQQA